MGSNILFIGGIDHTIAEFAGFTRREAPIDGEARLDIPEHVVRLNAVWNVVDPAEPSSRLFRVNLPVDWSGLSWPGGSPPRRLRLSRGFGRPAGLASTAQEARARLIVEGASAVLAVEFDGKPTTWRSAGPDRLVVDLPTLGPRNTAVIEIETAAASGVWGGVVLVFGGEAGSC